MDLKGKVALVTGGSSGIGLAFSKALLEHGTSVAICDVNVKQGEEVIKELVEKYGKDRVIFIKTDVTKEDEFEAAFKKATETFKALDIVLNNAGVFADNAWEKQVDINLSGVIRGTLLGLKHMGKDNGGKGGIIVNTASILGLDPCAISPIYAATKHGVVGLSTSLGIPFHFNRTGVKVVTICPSATTTALYVGGKKNALEIDWGNAFAEELKDVPVVGPDVVAKSLLQILNEAESGTIWVSEGTDTYRVNRATHKEMKVAQ